MFLSKFETLTDDLLAAKSVLDSAKEAFTSHEIALSELEIALSKLYRETKQSGEELLVRTSEGYFILDFDNESGTLIGYRKITQAL